MEKEKDVNTALIIYRNESGEEFRQNGEEKGKRVKERNEVGE